MDRNYDIIHSFPKYGYITGHGVANVHFQIRYSFSFLLKMSVDQGAHIIQIYFFIRFS